MNKVKFAVTVATGLIGALILLLIFTKTPEKALYDKTMNTMMVHEDFSSEEHLMKHYPELWEVNQKMERIADLNTTIHSLTAGPAPNLSIEERQKVQQCRHEISELQANINRQLEGLLLVYSQVQAD